MALELQQTTQHKWTPNYQNMSLIYKEFDTFFKKQINHKYVNLDSISKSEFSKNLVKNAFFDSEFEFYDFQNSIFNETIQSFLISQLIVIFLVFISTFNVLITLFSFLTLVLCQSTSIGILTLIGWKINLLESIGLILSTAITIDFILHLAIQYCNFIGNSYESDQEFTTIFFIREHTIKHVIGKVGSALCVSALVTCFTALCLIWSPVLVFKLYGVYFFILTMLSLIYAMFLFVPICASFGPLSNYCKIRNNKRSEKSFIEFKRANRTIRTIRNKMNQISHNTTSI